MDSMICVDLFQLRIFYDSMMLFFCVFLLIQTKGAEEKTPLNRMVL